MIGDSLPIMNYAVSGRLPQNYNPAPTYTNPNTTRLTLEQQYADMSNKMMSQQVGSDPYSDYLTTIQACTDVTRENIFQDERYMQIYAQCKNAIEQTIYARMIPDVMSTQQGRILFEQLHTTTKALKDEYTQKDIQRERDSVELEKRLTEREKRLEEKERQIDEILKKAGATVLQEADLSQPQQTYKNKQQHNNKSGNGGSVE